MSKWKISKTYAGGEFLYQVYRTLRENEPDHSGNREVIYSTEKLEDAEAYAEVMNR